MQNKLYLLICFVIGFGFMFSACNEKAEFDESIPLNPVMTPFKSVIAEDGDAISEAMISDKDRIIYLEFENLEDLTEVKVTLNVSKRAKLVSTQDTVLIIDLTQPYEITVNNIYDDITYTIEASNIESFLIDKSKFKANNLENDSEPGGDPMETLWNNRYMTVPETYATVGYQNYWTTSSFTFDIGDHYHLKQLRLHLYWAFTHTCPRVWELWGYMKPGEPPASGDWSEWTLLYERDNSHLTLDDFAEGDNIHFKAIDSPHVRYLRIINRQNWRDSPPLTNISISEITLWAFDL